MFIINFNFSLLQLKHLFGDKKISMINKINNILKGKNF